MNRYINALFLRFDGENGTDVPTKGEVAATWAIAAGVLVALLR